MKAGRPPKPPAPQPRKQRPGLYVRIPSHLRNELRNHLKDNPEPGLTQDAVVASALDAFLHTPAPDDILYDRLDRMTLQQDAINRRMEMMGLAFTEYLLYWFKLWPDYSPEETTRRRAKAPDRLTKYLSSLRSVVTGQTKDSLDLLDPDAIDSFLARRQKTSH